MTISVDRERCIGAGMCVLTAPEVFDQDTEDGRVILLDPAPPSRDDATARQAAHVCPSGAITIVSGNGRDEAPGQAPVISSPAP
ncbi:hypothetical protein GCM10010404_39380 [Nonomuraea africana]|uniref:Ferredoxin n=1 Tax=Nonomuraea africana TaxID=46171 RepID=A0ABR9KV59_9ACTN|nr:ferredoxin [Nonomuraea africana]MBE1565924.1 ferredoxin [Nonomuraea africana]